MHGVFELLAIFLQMLLILLLVLPGNAVAAAFVAGAFKRLTYGLVCLLHAVSTFSAFKMYLTPSEPYHLLFFAAWRMLAACITLFLLCDQDTLFTVTGSS